MVMAMVMMMILVIMMAIRRVVMMGSSPCPSCESVMVMRNTRIVIDEKDVLKSFISTRFHPNRFTSSFHGLEGPMKQNSTSLVFHRAHNLNRWSQKIPEQVLSVQLFEIPAVPLKLRCQNSNPTPKFYRIAQRLDWKGLDWKGLDWKGLDWKGLD